MKKIIIIAAGAILLTSCGTTGSGALTGAFFGELIGSAIGGIAGGPRGSDVGSLIGMAVGAGTGAAIGAASEKADGEATTYNSSRTSYTSRHASKYDCTEPQIEIQNARFINADNTLHINRGEVTQITYEIRNITNHTLHNVVADVDETTGNRHLTLSEPIRIESIEPHKAIRYTVSITASQSLKRGKAHYILFTTSRGKTNSNSVEFDIPLN